MTKPFLLTVRVALAAKRMGVSVEQVLDMVRHSARITHANGNRRFHEYLFTVEGERVTSIHRLTEAEVADEERRIRSFVRRPVQEESHYRCGTCRDTGKMLVFDPCDYCQGRGSCTHCDEGLVRREVNCPDCGQSRRVGVYQR